MTERIDHEVLATDALNRMFGESEGGALAWATQTQVHATLALVEQQRIANLIALAESGRTTVNGARQALSALYDGAVEDGTDRMFLRPDIAAALGFEVQG